MGYNSILHEFVSYENNCQQSKFLYRFRLDVQALISALFTFTLSVDSYEACVEHRIASLFKDTPFSGAFNYISPKLISATGMYFWLYQFAPLQNMNHLLDQSLLVRNIDRLLGGTETKSLYHPKRVGINQTSAFITMISSYFKVRGLMCRKQNLGAPSFIWLFLNSRSTECPYVCAKIKAWLIAVNCHGHNSFSTNKSV